MHSLLYAYLTTEARTELKDKELELINEGKDRDRQLNEAKRAMKGRKDLFKSVDYLLMGSTASSKHDGSNISDSQKDVSCNKGLLHLF